jgi:hypothetical protein
MTIRPCKPRDSARSALHANCTVRSRRSGLAVNPRRRHYTALRPLTGAAKYTRGAHEHVETEIESGPRLRVAHDPQSPMRSSDGHRLSPCSGRVVTHLVLVHVGSPDARRALRSSCGGAAAPPTGRPRPRPSPPSPALPAPQRGYIPRGYYARSVCLSLSVCPSVCLSVSHT